jgi:hypothetical protein
MVAVFLTLKYKTNPDIVMFLLTHFDERSRWNRSRISTWRQQALLSICKTICYSIFLELASERRDSKNCADITRLWDVSIELKRGSHNFLKCVNTRSFSTGKQEAATASQRVSQRLFLLRCPPFCDGACNYSPRNGRIRSSYSLVGR